MEFKAIKRDMVNWIKKISYNNDDLISKKGTAHCPNFATRCCLTCNKCWGGKSKAKILPARN